MASWEMWCTVGMQRMLWDKKGKSHIGLGSGGKIPRDHFGFGLEE